MRKDRSRTRKKNTRYKRKQRGYRFTISMVSLLALVIGIGIMAGFLTKIRTPDKSQGENTTSGIIEHEYEEQQTDTLYYSQEAGKIESILTETQQIVYSLHYPKFSQVDIDNDIYQLVKKMIQEAETIGQPVENLNERGMLYMNYDSYLVGQNIVSIIFYVEYNSKHLANPETYMISKHYNLDSGAELSDGELFRGDYLNAIATYCQNVLLSKEWFSTRFDDTMLETYFGAKKENYQNLSLTSEGVLVTFSKDLILSENKEYQINIPYVYMEQYLNFDYKSENIVIEEMEESTIQETEKPVIDTQKPMVALTFDDGPNPAVTERILDVLLEYNSRATFYVVGNRLKNYPDTLKRILNENSEIGSHTYNHKSLTLLTKKEIKNELAGVDDYLQELLGNTTVTLRPPYGAVNDLVRKTADKPLIYWSIDTEDWKNKNTNMIVKHVMNNVKDGDIILFHDLYDTTAAAIEILVPKLIEEGYQIVTVSEMFEAKGITLENGKVYYNAR